MAKYISLDNLTTYDGLIKQLITTTHAQSIQTVALSNDNTQLLFYKESEPLSAGASPAYSITIPHQSLDALMRKVISATSGNIAVFDANGAVIDGNVALNDLVTETEVQTIVNQAVAAANMIQAQIVETLPDPATASSNIIYLIKDNASGADDKYKEYMLISGTMTMIGDTGVDLTGYATEQYVNDRIAALNIPDIQAATTAEIQALFTTP